MKDIQYVSIDRAFLRRVVPVLLLLPVLSGLGFYWFNPLNLSALFSGVLCSVVAATVLFFCARRLAPSIDPSHEAALLQQLNTELEERKRIENTLRQTANEMTLLYHLSLTLTSGQNLYHVLRAFVKELKQTMVVDAFHIGLYNETTDIFRYSLFLNLDQDLQIPPRKLKDVPGLTAEVIFGRKTLYLQDITDPETRRQYAIHIVVEAGMRSYVGIPLLLDERVIGLMSVQSTRVAAYTPDQIRLLETLAAQVAITIEKASLLEQVQAELEERKRIEADLRQRESILEAVTFAAEQFLKTPDWRINMGLVLERLGQTLNATHAYLFEDHTGLQGELLTSMRYEWTRLGHSSGLAAGQFQNMLVHQDGFEEQVETLRRGDVRIGNSQTFTSIEKEAMDDLGIKALLEVPIFVNGREWGAIGFDDYETVREWNTTEVEALKIAAGVLSAAIQRQEAESAVRESERIYRQAIEAAGAVPYYQEYTVDGYRFMGQGIQKITGYSPEEMSMSLWDEIVQQADLQGELAELTLNEATKQVRSGLIDHWRCDYLIRARDGQLRWVADSAVEIRNEAGVSYASIGIMQDVTERKQAEASLRQREAVLAAVTFAAEQFLRSPDWRLDIDGVLMRLGETLQASHAYVFEHSIGSDGREYSLLKYEWTASGSVSDFENPYYQQPHVLNTQPGTTNHYLHQGRIFVGRLESFPEADRERLVALGVKSMIEVPLFVNETWWGTLGFDDFVVERDWGVAEADALKILAGILGAAIRRQNAEAALRESEAIYRQAIEAAGAVPYYRDFRENRYPFIGADIEKMIGYKPEEVTVELWRRIMLENVPLGMGAGLPINDAVHLARTGALKTWRSDMRVLARNGEERWITDSAVELFDDAETSYASVGILQDVTDRKRIEAQLRKRESILEAITFAAEQFLRAPDWRDRINLVLERLGREFNASHAYLFEKHIGPQGALLNSLRYEWTLPGQTSDLDNPAYQNAPTREEEFAEYYEILDSGEPFVGNSSYFHAVSNERLWASETGIKAMLEMRIVVDGKQWGTIGFDDMVNEREWTAIEVDVIRVASNVLGAAIKRQLDEAVLQQELAGRKQLIEELKLRNAESDTLRETTFIVTSTLDGAEAVKSILEQLKRVVAYDSASVWLYDGDRAVMVGEDGLPDIEGQFTSYPLSEQEPDYPIRAQAAPYILLDDIQQAYPQFHEVPTAYIRGWLSIPLRSRGRLIGFISLDSRQVGRFTERDAALALNFANQVAIALENARLFDEWQSKVAEREKLIGELENKNGELERFTYTVSHDLKSPLVTINGFLGYLEQDALSGNMDRLKRDMQRIQEAVRKMQNLLNELLQLSRVGRVTNPPERAPFHELVQEAQALVRGQINARGVVVRVQPGLPTVYVDKPRIIEVLQNLLDNAAKYMGTQSQPQIEIGQSGERDGKPVFFVRDNGMGIEPQYHERVFGLFNKLDPRSEGTGIGLALVKRIIEVHGGQIWVESQTGQGATFLFTLPTAPDKPSATGALRSDLGRA